MELVVVATVIVGPKLPDDFVAPPVRRSGLFPAITTISESDIEELQANRSRVNRFRSNPVPIGEVLTVSNWSTRLVAVERTETGAGSECRAEPGEVCLRIEFEIANLWDLDGDRGVTTMSSRWWVNAGSRTAREVGITEIAPVDANLCDCITVS